MSEAELTVSRGALRVALHVSVSPAAAARQFAVEQVGHEFEQWVDAVLPRLVAASEPALGQAAQQLQSGLAIAWSQFLEEKLAEQKSMAGGAA